MVNYSSMEESGESELSDDSSEDNDAERISILVNMNDNSNKDPRNHTHRPQNDYNIQDYEEEEPNAITVNEGIKNIEKTEDKVVLQNDKMVRRIQITANVNNPDSRSSSEHMKLSKKQKTRIRKHHKRQQEVFYKNKTQINLKQNLKKESNKSPTDEGFVDDKKFYMNNEKFHIHSLCQWAGSAEKFARIPHRYDLKFKGGDLSSKNSNFEGLQKQLTSKVIQRPNTLRENIQNGNDKK